MLAFLFLLVSSLMKLQLAFNAEGLIYVVMKFFTMIWILTDNTTIKRS